MKTSVTAIAKTLRGEGDDWESPADKRRLPKEAPLPGFMMEDEKKLTPAERGTITHRVLGQMDYGLVRAGDYAGALDRLQKQGVLSDEERSAVQLKWLKAFFSSPLGQRALAAPEVHREWAFNLKGSHRNMIQGVIDLCFLEDGQWVLADYKTDFASGEELVERYALQVRWYAHALALITRIPVKEACLFGLRAGESWPVSLEEPVEIEGN